MSKTDHNRIPGSHRVGRKWDWLDRSEAGYDRRGIKQADRESLLDAIADTVDINAPAKVFTYGLGTMPEVARPEYLDETDDDDDDLDEEPYEVDDEGVAFSTETDALVYSPIEERLDEDVDDFPESAWLPSMSFEQLVEEMGDGFHVELSPTRWENPVSTKASRDEVSIVSLARAWDVETKVMVEWVGCFLQFPVTASSRIPMHVIAATSQWFETFANVVLDEPERPVDSKRRLAEADRGPGLLDRLIRDEQRAHNQRFLGRRPVPPMQMATPRGFRPYWAPRSNNPFA